ncbi:MAG: hypothetical protein DHS20C05_16910 [Hyphococcus sp.]|nr:MAG: hypothetical protein DHS20C05_16910 [Marinicaulis sp.]
MKLKLLLLIYVCFALSAQALASNDVEDELLAMFEGSCRAVAISEAHGASNHVWLRNQLLLRKDLTDHVDIIAVEFANSFHQDLIDRYVIDGEDIDINEIAKIWRDTSQLTVWDSPIYEEFFKLARQGNLNRSPDRRVRILALGAPIDWANIENHEEIKPLLNRGKIMGERVRDHGVAVGRTLILVGFRHYELGVGQSTRIVERTFPGELCVVARIYGDDEATVHFAAQYIDNNQPKLFFPIVGTDIGGIEAKEMTYSSRRGSPKLEDIADGVIYLGSEVTQTQNPDPTIYEGWYGEELNRRAKIMWPQFGDKFFCPQFKDMGVEAKFC